MKVWEDGGEFFTYTREGDTCKIDKASLIKLGWTPPPEKKVYEGEVGQEGYLYFEDGLARTDFVNPQTLLKNKYVSKRVRITIEELR